MEHNPSEIPIYKVTLAAWSFYNFFVRNIFVCYPGLIHFSHLLYLSTYQEYVHQLPRLYFQPTNIGQTSQTHVISYYVEASRLHDKALATWIKQNSLFNRNYNADIFSIAVKLYIENAGTSTDTTWPAVHSNSNT